MTNTAKDQQERLRRNEQKWSRTVMAAGWTVLPSVILERQKALDLDAVDVCILMHLARHWWYEDNLPHPSRKTIAECMSIHVSTVQRRIAAMERDGLIRRIGRYDPVHGQQPNAYEFTGLIKAVTPLAEEALRERQDRKEKADARRTRKRPQLRVAKPLPSEEK
jgi:DNA-binding transcriptional regulator YhcF (GntR family)